MPRTSKSARRGLSAEGRRRLKRQRDHDHAERTAYAATSEIGGYHAFHCCRWGGAFLLSHIGVAGATSATLLTENGAFLLGNAHRCSVANERVARAGR